jgi:hypothetical protein
MPWEDIGDCGDGQVPHETDWIVCCLEMGIVYLRHVCGEPPEGCDLDIMWHDHELGNYPTIGLLWKDPQTDAPWKYISRCETALDAFNNAVTWSEINPSTIQDSFETNGGGEDEDSEK